jgi:hypothetical protein
METELRYNLPRQPTVSIQSLCTIFCRSYLLLPSRNEWVQRRQRAQKHLTSLSGDGSAPKKISLSLRVLLRCHYITVTRNVSQSVGSCSVTTSSTQASLHYSYTKCVSISGFTLLLYWNIYIWYLIRWTVIMDVCFLSYCSLQLLFIITQTGWLAWSRPWLVITNRKIVLTTKWNLVGSHCARCAGMDSQTEKYKYNIVDFNDCVIILTVLYVYWLKMCRCYRWYRLVLWLDVSYINVLIDGMNKNEMNKRVTRGDDVASTLRYRMLRVAFIYFYKYYS